MREGTPETIRDLYKILSSYFLELRRQTTDDGCFHRPSSIAHRQGVHVQRLHPRPHRTAGRSGRCCTNAIFRWESVAMIGRHDAGERLCQPVVPRLAGLGVAPRRADRRVAMVISSLTDPARCRRSWNRSSEKSTTPAVSVTRNCAAKLDEAEQYRRRIQEVVAQQKKRHPARSAGRYHHTQIYDWIANMVRWPDASTRTAPTTSFDAIRSPVPKEIRSWRCALAREPDPRCASRWQRRSNPSGSSWRACTSWTGRMERGGSTARPLAGGARHRLLSTTADQQQGCRLRPGRPAARRHSWRSNGAARPGGVVERGVRRD